MMSPLAIQAHLAIKYPRALHVIVHAVLKCDVSGYLFSSAGADASPQSACSPRWGSMRVRDLAQAPGV